MPLHLNWPREGVRQLLMVWLHVQSGAEHISSKEEACTFCIAEVCLVTVLTSAAEEWHASCTPKRIECEF